MKQAKFILILGLFFLIHQPEVSLTAQIPTQKEISEGKKDLERKGISEAEVERRMLLRGYNVNNIQPERIQEYRTALDEVIAEIEAENAQKASAAKEEKKSSDSSSEQSTKSEPAKSSSSDKPDESVSNIKEQREVNVEVAEKEASKAEKESEKKTETIKVQDPDDGIYGHKIFTKGQLSLYRAAEDITTPENYVLGTGDEILVSIFGRSQADFKLTINKEGYVSPTDMPKIFLKGVKLKDARRLLINRMQLRYSFLPEQFSASLVTARTVTLNIFGEVGQPGSYTISALNTGFNAILAAGGMSKNGSVRNIKLIKGDGQEKILDVYQYLSDPRIQFDFPIDDKDILYVPLSENIVTINGAVRRPMKYEMLEGETLKDLLGYAGGLRSNAFTQLAQISRLSGEERILIDLPLDHYLENNIDFTLRDGDAITIRTVEGELKEYVEINGHVEFPGQYDYQEGMTLGDLVEKARYKELTRTDMAFLFRENEDKTVKLQKLNLEEIDLDSFGLKKRDKFMFYSIRQFMDEQKEIEITGAVRRPTEVLFNPEDKVKLVDLITYAGGLKPNAMGQAMVTRIDRTNKQRVEYLELDVFQALADTSSDQNILLRQGDKINIYAVEQFTEAEEIEITGAVKDPKTLRYDESLDLREALLLAGGLTKSASDIAIIKSRPLDNNKEVSYRNVELSKVISGEIIEKLQARDVVRVYDKNIYMDDYQITISGEVRSPGEYAFDESLNLIDLIHMSGGLKRNASNIAIIKSFPVDNNKEVSYKRVELDRVLSGETEVQLKAKDRIRIYDKNVYMDEFQVSIMGEVREPGKFAFDESLSIQDLIYMAGGMTIKASTNKVELFRLSIMENQPTQILHKTIQLKREDDYKIKTSENIVLQPYDIVIIRPVPDFEFQEVVYINGQVDYPGPYILDRNKNERLKDLIKRAGGLKKDAFPTGATLVRSSGDAKGNVIIDLKKAIKRGRSYDNIVLRSGDVVFIPKLQNTISIRTVATLSREHLLESTLEHNSIQMAFQGRKSAKWYIRNYAGGFADGADRSSVRVLYPGGRIASTKTYMGFIRSYPTVVEGSTIMVNMKPPKPEKEDGAKPKEDVNWEAFARDTLALVTSILTLLVLVNRL